MNLIITGHRTQKLLTYDYAWISGAVRRQVKYLAIGYWVRGYSGMASGVDLMFCEACIVAGVTYVACIPFEEQAETMSLTDAKLREHYLERAIEKRLVKNSWMVDKADCALVVWDGNKGGTHNVVQQLIERQKPFYWINPVKQCVWECL